MGWISALWAAAVENGNDSGITCRWLLVGACGPLAGALGFVVMWLRAVLKELNEEKTGRLNDLRDQFKSMKDG